MALWQAIEIRKWDEANRLLDNPNFNVNLPVHYPPLEVCAERAKDSKDEHGDYVEDEYVRIMRRILQHPTFKRDPEIDPCSMALWEVCEKSKSVTAAKLLLKHENLDLGPKYIGLPMLHSMMRNLRCSNIDIKTQILREFLGYPLIGDFIYRLDNFGLSVLDRFLCNTDIHCYDLEITVNAIKILEMLDCEGSHYRFG